MLQVRGYKRVVKKSFVKERSSSVIYLSPVQLMFPKQVEVYKLFAPFERCYFFTSRSNILSRAKTVFTKIAQ